MYQFLMPLNTKTIIKILLPIVSIIIGMFLI